MLETASVPIRTRIAVRTLAGTKLNSYAIGVLLVRCVLADRSQYTTCGAFVKGQFGERVRVLANGLDSMDVSGLSEDHQVSVDSILADRVEIIRGPATLLYGSGAAGGLVNVVDSRINESPLEQPFSGALSANGDSAIGEIAAAGKLSAGSERVAVYADYFYRQTDDVSIPGRRSGAGVGASPELQPIP